MSYVLEWILPKIKSSSSRLQNFGRPDSTWDRRAALVAADLDQVAGTVAQMSKVPVAQRNVGAEPILRNVVSACIRSRKIAHESVPSPKK
jgi:hypothetical protein